MNDMTAQEKAVYAYYLIAIAGHELTTAEVAQRTGLGWHGAWHMLSKMARVVPLYQDDDDRRWKRIGSTQ